MKRALSVLALLFAIAGCGNPPPEVADVDAGTETADAGQTANGDPTNPLALTATIAPNPPQVGRNTLSVTIKGANGVPVTGATLKVKVFSPAMGHGSSETPVVTESGNGVYTVTRVTFTMVGQWQVTLDATKGALSGTKVLDYTVN